MPSLHPTWLFEDEVRRLISEDIERGRRHLENQHQTEVQTAYLRGQISALRKIEELMVLARENLDKRNA